MAQQRFSAGKTGALMGHPQRTGLTIDAEVSMVSDARIPGSWLLDSITVFEDFVLPDETTIDTVIAAEGFGPISLSGNSKLNTLIGNSDANTLNGGGGNDILQGGGGNDVYIVDSADDQVVEFAGSDVDTVVFMLLGAGFSTYSIAGNAAVENLTAAGDTDAIVDLYGNAGNNVLRGHAGSNLLFGNGGADTMIGGGGIDIYVVDDGGDVVVEGFDNGTVDRIETAIDYVLPDSVRVEFLAFIDWQSEQAHSITGNRYGNEIHGNDGDSTLNGRSGDDILNGRGGDDRLIGGIGRDHLIGRTGDDTFVFNSAPGTGNADTVEDFLNADSGNDTIELAGTVFQGLGSGTLHATKFVLGATGQGTGACIVYNQATGELLYDPDGGLVRAATVFATLKYKPANITASDFLVV